MFSLSSISAQKVGVVLSGGGATGLAHIGILKALEEAEIPIDYITGTSAGAFVGALYSVGYSPEEIEKYVLSDVFKVMYEGDIPPSKKFALRNSESHAGMISVPFALDSTFRNTLPTNFMTPFYLDYEMFRILGISSYSVGDDFDNLFVPFRCVASDITAKKSKVFEKGKLNQVVRASMTYPFYINPIRIDDVLYFDGGLYNNFPADVLYENFDVDYIIGSNVSYNAEPPTESDLISQITNMLVVPTDYDLPCEYGVVINPQTDVGTFDFSKSKEAIDAGYRHGLEYVDSIRQHVKRKVTKDSIQNKRSEFLQKLKDINISEVRSKNTLSPDKERIEFVEKSILKDSVTEPLDFNKFSDRYFRIYSAPQIKYTYPTIEEATDSTELVNIDITKQKPFILDVGGHFSSRPVNTGYIGLTYLGLSDAAMKLNASSYFGKFYGSAQVKLDFDVPSTFPFRVSPYFTMNRWDYFRSFSTFFEDVRPSFLVQNEMYYGSKLSFPLGNSFKASFDFRAFDIEDKYYQSEDFSNADTTDFTNFDGQSASFSIERNSLNRKQWATEGSLLRAKFRYVQGREQSISGSTAPFEYDVRRRHQWVNITAEGQSFPLTHKNFKLGVHAKGVLNSQSLFANYTASLLMMTEFGPIPDAYTFFMEEYRAPQYVGAGLNLISSIYDVIDLRLDPYIFQPFRRLVRNNDGTFGYSDLFERGTLMAAASVIYHSPIGPLRLTTNYFPQQSNPFVFQLSFGYVLFNERAVR